jgi:hypothetical protein
MFGEIEGLLDGILALSAQLHELAANAALGHVDDLNLDLDQVIFGGKFYQQPEFLPDMKSSYQLGFAFDKRPSQADIGDSLLPMKTLYNG